MPVTSHTLLTDLDGVVKQFSEALGDLKKVQMASRPVEDRLPSVPPDGRIELEFAEGYEDGYVIDCNPCVMFRFVEGQIGIEMMIDDDAATAFIDAVTAFPERSDLGIVGRATLDGILEFNLENVDADDLRQLAEKLEQMAQKVRQKLAEDDGG